MPRFYVYLTNFSYYLDADYGSLEAAVTAGKVRGFDFNVVRSARGQHPFRAEAGDLQLVASWSILGGLRDYARVNLMGALRRSVPEVQ